MVSAPDPPGLRSGGPLLKRLIRAPLTHFIALGAGIYILYGLVSPNEATQSETTITITSAEIWYTPGKPKQ